MFRLRPDFVMSLTLWTHRNELPVLIDEDGDGGECNTSMIMSDRSEVGIPSMSHPASDERSSDSVEPCETAVCFLRIQLTGTKDRLPKNHRIPPDWLWIWTADARQEKAFQDDVGAYFWQFSHRLQLFWFELVVVEKRYGNFIYNCFVFLFANSQYLSTQFLCISFHVVRQCHYLFISSSRIWQLSVAPAEIRDSNIIRYPSTRFWFGLHSRWVHPKKSCSRNGVGFSDQFCSSEFSTLVPNVASFLPFWYRPRTRIRIILIGDGWTDIPSSVLSAIRFEATCSRLVLPIIDLQEDIRTNFFPVLRPVLQRCATFFRHLYRGRRVQTSGHSDSGCFSNVGESSTLTWVQADTASLACPAHPGRLAITSWTFASVICDADEPCSVNTAKDPESSFTILPRSSTGPLYFLEPLLQLRVLEVTQSHHVAKWTVLNSFCDFSMTSLLLMTFVTFQAGNFSSFSTLCQKRLSHPGFSFLET